jgi:hypothetical protein
MVRLEAEVISLRGLNPLYEVPRYVTSRLRFQEFMNLTVYTETMITSLKNEEIAHKAMGLLPPDFDLVDYNLTTPYNGLMGVYVPWDKNIYVFGTQFSGVERFVYVHEYVHALTDQHFKISEMGLYPTCLGDGQRCKAIRALLEGDATLLMYEWWLQYASESDYQDFWYYPPPSLAGGGEPPAYFIVDSNFVYDYGLRFVQSLHNRNGWDSVNRAYQDLPDSTEQILHPEKYAMNELPKTVNDPPILGILGSDWTLAIDDSMGEWDTYLLLGYGANSAARLDDSVAKMAAEGWGGDHFVTLYNPATGQTLLTMHWVWDRSADAREFNAALREYNQRRFAANAVSLEKGDCWEASGQTSCMLTYGQETLWLVSPDQEWMSILFSAYPAFK